MTDGLSVCPGRGSCSQACTKTSSTSSERVHVRDQNLNLTVYVSCISINVCMYRLTKSETKLVSTYIFSASPTRLLTDRDVRADSVGSRASATDSVCGSGLPRAPKPRVCDYYFYIGATIFIYVCIHTSLGPI